MCQTLYSTVRLSVKHPSVLPPALRHLQEGPGAPQPLCPRKLLPGVSVRNKITNFASSVDQEGWRADFSSKMFFDLIAHIFGRDDPFIPISPVFIRINSQSLTALFPGLCRGERNGKGWGISVAVGDA